MKMSLKERQEVLKKIDEIENKHCVGCELKEKREFMQRACAKFCEIGREIAEIGNQLINKSELKEIKKSTNRGSKRDEILLLYDKGYKGKEIVEKTGIAQNTVYSTLARHRKEKGGA